MKYQRTRFTICLLLGILLFHFPVFHAEASRSNPPIPQAELTQLVRPALTQVVVQISGTATIPAFDIDARTLAVTERSQKNSVSPIAFSFSTSTIGFFVTEDGVIACSANFFSDQALRERIVAQNLRSLIVRSIQTAEKAFPGSKQPDKHNINEKLSNNVRNFLLARTTLTTTRAFSMVPPTIEWTLGSENRTNTAQEKPLRAILSLLTVSTYQSNPEHNIALLKSETRLNPTLPIRISDELEPNSLKYTFQPSSSNTVKYVQSEIIEKSTISPVSQFQYYTLYSTSTLFRTSGPLLNAQGEVVAIIDDVPNPITPTSTLRTAVSASQLLALTLRATTTPMRQYMDHYLEAQQLVSQRHCKKALEHIHALTSYEYGSRGTTISTYLTMNEQYCNDLIASGLSLDAPVDFLYEWYTERGVLFWLCIVLYFTLSVLCAMILLRWLKHFIHPQKLVTQTRILPTPAKIPEARISDLNHMDASATHITPFAPIGSFTPILPTPPTKMPKIHDEQLSNTDLSPSLPQASRPTDKKSPRKATEQRGAKVLKKIAFTDESQTAVIPPSAFVSVGNDLKGFSETNALNIANTAPKKNSLRRDQNTQTQSHANIQESLRMYIQNARAHGQNDVVTRQILLDAKWNAIHIDEAFSLEP